MNYFLIGSGNMAWFMASRMQAAGHTCNGILGRNKEAVSAIAQEFNIPVVQSINDGADACLLAVADHAIGTVAATLQLNSTVLIHHSGSVAMNALTAGATRTGVVWPVYSILKKDLPVHRQFPCLYETNGAAAQKVVQDACTAISSIQYEADSAQRQWMHLAAVVGNNFTNFLLGICTDICKEQRLPFNLLQPILQQTLDRVQLQDPKEVQTGPARRNDTGTQQAHLELMQAHPAWQAVYTAISAAIKNSYPAPAASS
jgi:predicted short-subunit dehydrogenase-like oxidoreductase (DUF2520 family)